MYTYEYVFFDGLFLKDVKIILADALKCFANCVSCVVHGHILGACDMYCRKGPNAIANDQHVDANSL